MGQRWELLEYGNGRFSISDCGKVINNETLKIYSTQVQNSGYEMVHLNYLGKRKAFTVHRLVAIAFINKVEGKEFVDHIDANKLNNYYTNLRWVDSFENMQHAYKSGCLLNSNKKASIRMKELGKTYGFDNSQKYLKKAIPVYLFFNEGIHFFRSTRQASILLKIDHKTLIARIKKGMYKIPA